MSWLQLIIIMIEKTWLIVERIVIAKIFQTGMVGMVMDKNQPLCSSEVHETAYDGTKPNNHRTE